MSCRKTTPASNGWVIYTGGPPTAPFAALKHLLPEKYPASISGAGVIQYEDREPPPPIEGYRQEGLNFYPIWPNCRWRLYQVAIRDCGAIAIKAKCGNPEGPLGDSVTYQQCVGCGSRVPIPAPFTPQRKRLKA